jgi:hypothetical protein
VDFLLLDLPSSRKSRFLSCVKLKEVYGLKRAKDGGKQLGQSSGVPRKAQGQATQWLKAWMPVAKMARQLGTTRQTIMRLRDRKVA